MPLTWTVAREGDLGTADHTELAAMLATAYPQYPGKFTGTRSWLGARPEARVVGRDGEVAAHAGVVRRFVRAGDTDQLVAIVGLVGVRPDLAGAGHGREVMARTAALLDDLAVPFGLLLCDAHLTGFYTACGWHARPCASTTLAFDPWNPAAERVDVPAMVLPVRAALADWPRGDLRWNTQQV
ncbi:GNAT family N-acetyltransferase [Phytomonospora endophytica]|uniref:Nodulation protein A n=1 Tax=Phytomonospora endophytica TaxID=714109 RepID=A0A841FA00_9ACTN|nr:GNAT family N-acetyltransferase [Phytomonospora endophytica]MBB6033076.1 nodulation protein A [Phytomonospora endophytica]GIG65303.1 nodulation protein A [Phytomonospora endophytica]